jgi:alpha-1,6-mannosyltransferase
MASLSSNAPSQELRFIIYVFPILTLPAAMACERLWTSKGLRLLLRTAVVGAVLGGLLITAVFAVAAHYNYPGGVALRRLQAECDNFCGTPANPVSVHIGNLAAQTGASRFGETQPHMTFSKIEQWTAAEPAASFDYLLMEPKGGGVE